MKKKLISSDIILENILKNVDIKNPILKPIKVPIELIALEWSM